MHEKTDKKGKTNYGKINNGKAEASKFLTRHFQSTRPTSQSMLSLNVFAIKINISMSGCLVPLHHLFTATAVIFSFLAKARCVISLFCKASSNRSANLFTLGLYGKVLIYA